LYDFALRQFQQSIADDPTYSDAYLYGSFSMLKGRRPRVVMLSEIEKIVQYLSATTAFL